MIHVVRWDCNTDIDSCRVSQSLPHHWRELNETEILWIALDNPTVDEEAQILKSFMPLHPLTLEDVTRPRRLPTEGAHLPKVEEFPDYLFVVVNPLPKVMSAPVRRVQSIEVANTNEAVSDATCSRRRWRRPQLNGIISKNLLITVHYEELPCVNTVLGYVHRRAEMAARGPDYLFHLILDEMVDEYAPVVERFGLELDRMETTMFANSTPKVLSKLLKLKRKVVFLRKTLILEREVLARLVRGEFSLVSNQEIVYYRNVYDHLVRYSELIEGSREMVSDLMQMHLATASNRLNEVMKVLTMISTIILPMTLIAGVYGMNFDQMPELKWSLGYPFAITLMFLSTLISLGAFRYLKWI